MPHIAAATAARSVGMEQLRSPVGWMDMLLMMVMMMRAKAKAVSQ
jgi:hypothetical protein